MRMMWGVLGLVIGCGNDKAKEPPPAPPPPPVVVAIDAPPPIDAAPPPAIDAAPSGDPNQDTHVDITSIAELDLHHPSAEVKPWLDVLTVRVHACYTNGNDGKPFDTTAHVRYEKSVEVDLGTLTGPLAACVRDAIATPADAWSPVPPGGAGNTGLTLSLHVGPRVLSAGPVAGTVRKMQWIDYEVTGARPESVLKPWLKGEVDDATHPCLQKATTQNVTVTFEISAANKVLKPHAAELPAADKCLAEAMGKLTPPGSGAAHVKLVEVIVDIGR